MNILKALLCFIIILNLSYGLQAAKKEKTSLINNINDLKEFKKTLKSRTNVLVIFVNRPKAAQDVVGTLKYVSNTVKGEATIVHVNCNNSDAKKICKKFKVDPAVGYCIKHFKDGEFHKDYDRAKKASSFVNFLQDPKGDLPWDEDPSATDVVHLSDASAVNKFFKKGQGSFKNVMVMFYAPWCGYCKKFKPDYSLAASELKGQSILAAVDVSKQDNTKIRLHYNITGFPTLLFFERGVLKFPYNGQYTKDALLQFMKDPTSQPPKEPPKEVGWSTDSDIVHLTVDSFDKVLQGADVAIVAFYAPWCGHCKMLKPEFEKAATEVKKLGLKGVVAAVDGTQEGPLVAKYQIQGYPTIKYFEKGIFKFDAGHLRESSKIISFIQDPQEPPPPPPPEAPWSEQPSNVLHLNSTNFRSTLKRFQHALVMFYAPWCGHCKSAKPEVIKAADDLVGEYDVAVAAVDCTVDNSVCKDYGVKGFPTFKYFSYFDKLKKDYTGGRTAADFLSFLHNEMKNWVRQISEHPKKEAFDSEVKHLTDDDFEQYISDSKPTFVMFYTTWCTNCVDAKPAFASASKRLIAENSPIRFAAADCTDNTLVADLAEIQIIPTFKLYKNGKEIAVYDGARNMEDMIKFTKTKSGIYDKTEL